MTKATFRALLDLLFRRWPHSKEAMKDYSMDLWAMVSDWSKDKVGHLKKAIREFVADQKRFGIPTPEQVVGKAHSLDEAYTEWLAEQHEERRKLLVAEYEIRHMPLEDGTPSLGELNPRLMVNEETARKAFRRVFFYVQCPECAHGIGRLDCCGSEGRDWFWTCVGCLKPFKTPPLKTIEGVEPEGALVEAILVPDEERRAAVLKFLKDSRRIEDKFLTEEPPAGDFPDDQPIPF